MDGKSTIIDHIYEVCRVNIVCDGDNYYRNAVCKEARIGLCSSLGSVEAVIKKDAEDSYFLEPAHSYIVRLLQTDTLVDDYSVDAEYVYDSVGQPLDKLDRFRVGDICEVLWADMRPHPAIVAQIPPDSHGYYDRNAYQVVMIDETGRCVEIFIDKLRVYEPRERIHPSTVRKLQRALEDFRTAPTRETIKRITYEQRLHALVDDLGIEFRILASEYPRENMLDLIIELTDIPGYKRGILDVTPFGPLKRISIGVPYWKIDKRPEMIRNGLLGLLGRPYTGKAFRLKEAEVPEIPRDPESKYYYY